MNRSFQRMLLFKLTSSDDRLLIKLFEPKCIDKHLALSLSLSRSLWLFLYIYICAHTELLKSNSKFGAIQKIKIRFHNQSLSNPSTCGKVTRKKQIIQEMKNKIHKPTSSVTCETVSVLIPKQNPNRVHHATRAYPQTCARTHGLHVVFQLDATRVPAGRSQGKPSVSFFIPRL